MLLVLCTGQNHTCCARENPGNEFLGWEYYNYTVLGVLQYSSTVLGFDRLRDHDFQISKSTKNVPQTLN